MAKVIAMGEDCSHNLVNNLLHYSQHLHQDLRLKNEQRTTNNVTFPKSEQKINRKFQRQRNTELNTKYCLDCVNKTWKKKTFSMFHWYHQLKPVLPEHWTVEQPTTFHLTQKTFHIACDLKSLLANYSIAREIRCVYKVNSILVSYVRRLRP